MSGEPSGRGAEEILFQKLVARIADREVEVEAGADGDGYRIRTASGETDATWQPLEGGRVLFTLRGRPLVLRVQRAGEGAWRIESRGRIFTVQVEDDLARRARVAHAHAGPVPLRSPMPGMVLKVLVEEGQTVTLEQPVLIIEAMKMQNELAAPATGTVVSVQVRPGQAVEGDQVLLEIRV